MRFVIEYWSQIGHRFLYLSEHKTYDEAKREMNAGYNLNKSRRLKVVDERTLYKAKAGKYMDDGSTTNRQPIAPFK